MAKTPKKRANTKGAAKKAAPKKAHKKVKKPARSCLQAVVEQEAKKRGANPIRDLRQANLEALRQPKPSGWNEFEAHGHATVAGAEAALAALVASTASAAAFGAKVAQPQRYRFRDAITGLFVRAAAALKRKATTVRERVR